MNIRYAFVRLLTKMKPNAVMNCTIDKKANIGHGAQMVHTTVGRYTYCGNGVTAVHAEIGSFCSIAGNTTIGGGGHPLGMVSTSPVFYGGRNVFRTNFADTPYEPYKKTVIGHDVWIGARCLIKGGVTIGTGAVVGMGSVVTKDVPPYMIVAGNPAKPIRMRFDEETVKALTDSRWWELPEKTLRALGPSMADPAAFLKSLKEGNVKE
ncbi:MAG: CatB-related O-acetyltransferase [Clostridia bacterium]|nr:CatB-related O-acetyltransferase [Clostridia bacterium]